MSRPLILITNDDGYKAKGIEELINMAKRIGDVIAVAPEVGQSGKSHAISLNNFVRMQDIRHEPGIDVYSVSGTPVDCVKMAMNKVLSRKPDLLLSGINHGSNATVNAFYSGTMGAAIEGAFYDIPSVGLSLCSYDADADFSVVVKHSEPFIRRLLEMDDNKGICLNVNYPAIAEADYKGMRICRQARGIWKEEFVENTDPYGRKYYWLTGNFVNHEPQSTDTDEWALSNGYASVVPMTLDSTDKNLLHKFDNLL